MLSDKSRKRSAELIIPEDVDILSDDVFLSAAGELETSALAKQEGNLETVSQGN